MPTHTGNRTEIYPGLKWLRALIIHRLGFTSLPSSRNRRLCIPTKFTTPSTNSCHGCMCLRPIYSAKRRCNNTF